MKDNKKDITPSAPPKKHNRFVQYFINLGHRIKGWFVDKWTAIKDFFGSIKTYKQRKLEAELVTNDGPQLTKGEKFRRGLKAQSI